MQDASEPALVVGISRFEKSDFADVFRLVEKARPGPDGETVFTVGLFAAVSSGVLVARIWMGAEPSKTGIVLLTFVVLMLLLFGTALHHYVNAAAIALARLPDWEREVRFEFCSSVMRVRTARSFNQHDWELFSGWVETPLTFFIRGNDAGGAYIVPKRGLGGDAAIDTVRELLRSRVAAIIESRFGRARRFATYAGLVALGCLLVWSQWSPRGVNTPLAASRGDGPERCAPSAPTLTR